MAHPRGSATYKKQDGILEVAKNGNALTWTPAGPKPALSLPVSGITNLQQTPVTNPKVMLRVITQPVGSKDTETHVFTYTNPSTARAEADAIRDSLSKAIQAFKAGSSGSASTGGASASMAIASAISSKGANNLNVIYDDDKLVQDVELQRSLLDADVSLKRTFDGSRKTKPDTMSLSQFQNQFWSSRVHLLRAHAIEKSQTRGSYNVLATIKPVTVDGMTKLSVTKEQIQLLFTQHPVVQRAYDENVPKVPEESFWARFFQSRLSKKLKGERLLEQDPADPVLDKYLNVDEEAERARRLMAAHVPHIIDIEGNEENHSQRKGNDGDITMRAKTLDRAPIIRTLNSLSEKILSHVAPNDIDPSLPIGVDEETYNELRLRDLQGDAEEHRNILNIKDQSRFFSFNEESGLSADAHLYAKQNPAKVLKNIQTDLAKASGYNDLAAAIGVDEDSDSSDEEEEGHERPQHVGSKSARAAATSQILSAITQERLLIDGGDSSTDTRAGLSETLFNRLTLTHATTTEFLNHFWKAFLSGSTSRADEISKLIETLDRAMDRIKAVATDAEKERQAQIEELEKKVREFNQRTGKKRRVDSQAVPGGKKAVDQLIGPTVKAIEKAGSEYRRVLKEQMREAGEG